MTPKTGSKRLVTLADAADYGSVSERTIRRRIAAGALTGYRFGPKLIRVDLNELEAGLTEIPAGNAHHAG